jgi:hypothetical protein
VACAGGGFKDSRAKKKLVNRTKFKSRTKGTLGMSRNS